MGEISSIDGVEESKVLLKIPSGGLRLRWESLRNGFPSVDRKYVRLDPRKFLQRPERVSVKSRAENVLAKMIPFCLACGIYFLIYEGLGGCPIDRIFHRECPGCRCLEAFFLLVKGDIKGSLNVQPFLLPYITAILAGNLPVCRGKVIVEWYIILTACGGLVYHILK